MSARTPSHPKNPRTWLAYKIAGRRAAMLGHVAAATMEKAIAAAAEESRIDPQRVIEQQAGGNA
jgi:hypothetical protein